MKGEMAPIGIAQEMGEQRPRRMVEDSSQAMAKCLRDVFSMLKDLPKAKSPITSKEK